MKASITTVLKRWEELKKSIDVEEKYKNYQVFRIEPIDITIHNNIYISSNIKEEMNILIEFEPESLEEVKIQKAVGIETQIITEEKINPNKKYLVIKKKECNKELFMAFSISVTEALVVANTDNDTIKAIKYVIEQYSCMFSKEGTKLTRKMEQGLYCELRYLENIIDLNGDKTVTNWTGPEANKHDFIFDNYAVEIKSTANQEQTIIKISNENQLDKNDLDNLFLKVYIVETNPRGEFLQDIIKRISSKITNVEMLSRFKTCLLLDGVDVENFTSQYCFKIIREIEYDVNDDFPKITKSNIPNETFDVEYKLNLSSVNEMDG